MLKISKRLCTASQYVRSGAMVADIGTDHAYLPIYLALEKRIKRAVASDINEGPLNTARENIKRYSCENIIDTYLTNGLNGIDKFNPTDIVICGMGGELIAKILEDSRELVCNSSIRLVLQPMTMVKELREYLSNGFSTIAENIVFEDNKLYQIICVEYDGVKRLLTNAQLELGPKNIENGGELYERLLFSTIVKKQKKLDGKRLGGQDTKEVECELNELIELSKEIKKWPFMICIISCLRSIQNL